MGDTFHPAAAVSDVAPGKMIRCEIGGTAVAVANVDGAFYAFEDCCTHMHYPLTWGWIEDGHKVVCGCHYGSFDVRTGRALEPPCTEAVRTYPVRVADGCRAMVNQNLRSSS